MPPPRPHLFYVTIFTEILKTFGMVHIILKILKQDVIRLANRAIWAKAPKKFGTFLPNWAHKNVQHNPMAGF